jgi:hypothetical protein
MAPLTDAERRRHYFRALSSYECSGYVTFEQRAYEWVRSELGLTGSAFSRLMWEHVKGEGEIGEVRETRREYREHEFHHDLRFAVAGRTIYVETRLLMERDIDDTTINVVNVHDA